MNTFQRKIEVRKEVFPRGARVRAVSFARDRSVDEDVSVSPGIEGYVVAVDDLGTVHVSWDNGANLGVLLEDNLTPA
jgi:hypothetical protein